MRKIRKEKAYRILSIVYCVIAIGLFFLALWTAFGLSTAYNRGEIVVDTQEKLDAVGFVSSVAVLAGIAVGASGFCLIVSVLLYAFSLEERIKKLEKAGQKN